MLSRGAQTFAYNILPEMDGFEATHAIREKERSGGTHLPIIALTAHAMKGEPPSANLESQDELSEQTL